MFDVLVEPVLSYASHIWGPLSFRKRLRASPFSTESEGVHASYLHIMAGANKSASLDVIYRDLHRIPVMYHWVVLAVRWWTKISKARLDEQSMACRAWVEDVKLARAGCTTCWSSHLLHTLCSLNLLDGGWRQQPLDWLLGRSWEEGVVQQTLDALFKARWQGPFPDDPRVAPTIGCAHLEVEQGRKRRPKVPRHDRLCKLCSGEDAPLGRWLAAFSRTGTGRNVEDLKHFLLECPVYDDLRAACPAFPANVYSTLSHPGCVAAVMGHGAQAALASTLYRMKVR